MKNDKTIYIIDDDPIILFGIKKMLGKITSNHKILEFENGKTALETIHGQMENNGKIPETIFLDINMPIMDGWQFLDEFIKLPLKERVIVNIITSSIDPSDRNKWRFYKSLTNHYIAFKNKPIFKIEIDDILRIDLAS